MSYSHQYAKMEREEEVREALDTKDSEALYNLAELYELEGDEETANQLIHIARGWDSEDWAYDVANNR